MALITLSDLSIGFRGPSLLDGVSAQIDAKQKIGLLGRNGAGKTTLLKILVGDVTPDHGSVQFASGTTIARLVQDVPHDLQGTIQSVVRAGLTSDNSNSTAEDQAWQIDHAVDQTLSRMQLDPNVNFQTLSSGMKRRVLLARAIARDPDVLLLDEPTNHLDIPAIEWLEDFLSRWDKTLIFVTHDRKFLQNLATRIWEIDRGKLFDWSCDYQTFLQRKEQMLAAEEKQNALFDKKLAQEEAWIRQGIKARRTRNEGRVKALKKMRDTHRQRRTAEGQAKLNLQEADRSGALVAEVKDVSFAYDDTPIMKDFSTTIMRGDKLGIIGPNGAGKSTLLKIILGQIEPNDGSVRLGTNLQIAYFDQLRDSLNENATVEENVGGGTDRIKLGDKTKHIMGYLQDFLFTPERARTEVRFLSGGERNRVLLAKLMTQPANVIVLDEPTNDLDSETLELLEEQLVSFGGTVLMVSHDRTFLNHVVTSTIVFEDGQINEYVGGYDDWQAAVTRRQSEQPKPAATSKPEDKQAERPTTRTKKLTYKEQRELEQLPETIESLEKQIADAHEKMADPDYYRQNGDVISADAEALKALESDLQRAYSRWELLDS